MIEFFLALKIFIKLYKIKYKTKHSGRIERNSSILKKKSKL
jgi:hypothetical protein